MRDSAETERLGDGHRPLRDVVCDAIRFQIVNGDHLPGARLVEDRLAEELGVSRNPVREALRDLKAEGFVEMIPRRGAVVSVLSVREAEEIFEVRSALDALAARLAARKCGPEQRAALHQILDDTKAALAAGERGTLSVLNTEFHGLIVEIAQNSCLHDLWYPLRGRMQWIFSRTVVQRGNHSFEEHFELAEAILERNEERAAHLALDHIDAARRSYLEEMESLGAAPDGAVRPTLNGHDSSVVATAPPKRARATRPRA
jgi:DNA-binding GntR family transcriptional regulator